MGSIIERFGTGSPGRDSRGSRWTDAHCRSELGLPTIGQAEELTATYAVEGLRR